MCNWDFSSVSVHSILLFCVYMSDCIGLVVPNKTLWTWDGNCIVSKQVFVWIAYILDMCVCTVFVPHCSRPTVFQCKSTQSRMNATKLYFFPNYLPKLVTFKMLFVGFLPNVLSMKSVAGCEPAA